MRLRPSVSSALALLVGAWVALPAVAEAQPKSRDDGYFAPKLMLGIAGNVGFGASAPGGANLSADADPELTFGGGFAYMKPLHRYFVLGGQLALQSWKTKNSSGDRNLMGDLTVVPQARLPLTHDVELFVSLPIGISLDILNQVGVNVAGIANVEADNALGFTVSLLAGARFALSDGFGLLAELGYTLHSFSHSITVQAPLVTATGGDVDVTIEQLALDVGVFF
jgi:hypothetical protein